MLSEAKQKCKNMYFVYILECSDRSLYVGCTNNLERRFFQHNHSLKGASYTKKRRPVTLIYSEKYNTLTEARRREKEIKGWRRTKKLQLINFSKAKMSERLTSKEFKAGGRIYYFDIHETKNKNRYVHIKETKTVKGKREEHELIVFIEYLDEFIETLNKVKESLK